jgi:hypothetical protein
MQRSLRFFMHRRSAFGYSAPWPNVRLLRIAVIVPAPNEPAIRSRPTRKLHRLPEGAPALSGPKKSKTPPTYVQFHGSCGILLVGTSTAVD